MMCKWSGLQTIASTPPLLNRMLLKRLLESHLQVRYCRIPCGLHFQEVEFQSLRKLAEIVKTRHLYELIFLQHIFKTSLNHCIQSTGILI